MRKTDRIAKTFKKSKARIGYLTAGDGGIEKTFKASMALIKGGINMLEIGMPYSDPIADGAVIQQASLRALKCRTNFEKVFRLTKKIRRHTDIPLILFSYLNPIYQLLLKNQFHQIKSAGFDGLLIVDCPYDELPFLYKQCLRENLSPISVISTSTSINRIKKISKQAKGFLYYACQKGTTGIKHTLPDNFIHKIREIQSQTALPIVTGFGISNPKMVKDVLKISDGVVIGSLFVKTLENSVDYVELTNICQKLFGKLDRTSLHEKSRLE